MTARQQMKSILFYGEFRALQFPARSCQTNFSIHARWQTFHLVLPIYKCHLNLRLEWGRPRARACVRIQMGRARAWRRLGARGRGAPPPRLGPRRADGAARAPATPPSDTGARRALINTVAGTGGR